MTDDNLRLLQSRRLAAQIARLLSRLHESTPLLDEQQMDAVVESHAMACQIVGYLSDPEMNAAATARACERLEYLSPPRWEDEALRLLQAMVDETLVLVAESGIRDEDLDLGPMS
jgi:hypothetical protein